MCASISDNTIKQYGVVFKKWFLYCNNHNVNVFEASVPYIISFLTEIFHTGVQYSTLNTYRSALSLIVNSRIGPDDRLTRLFKGFYRLRPPTPKYNFTWNPAVVLNFLENWYPNEDISLEQLTKKVVTLIALVTAHRVQTLSKIQISNIAHLNNERIIIKIPSLIKTSRPGSLQPCLVLPFFEEKPQICPAKALSVYINQTNSIRQDDQLFISFKSPYKPVCSQSISRWIKEILSNSGIDTNIFSAHSTRHASTSSAQRQGVNMDVIRKTAGWSDSSSVFARFYQKSLISDDSNDFATSILKNY
jgi:integrase